MRLSIYTFNDLTNSYAIIQFEGSEINGLLNELLNGDLISIAKKVEQALGCKAKSISLAKGEMLYEDTRMPMAYLRIDLDNSEQYSLEVYGESATVITNMNLRETYIKVLSLIRAFIPNIKLPKSRLITL